MTFKIGPPVRERILSRIEFDTNGGCWLWAASVNPDGYGWIKVAGRMMGVHRAAWQEFVGSIPKGKQVLHRCDIPCCVNPGHLFLGTNADNVADRVAKGRNGSHSGDRNGRAKLSVAEAMAILSDEGGPGATTRLAVRYGITRDAVGALRRRKNWPHLTLSSPSANPSS